MYGHEVGTLNFSHTVKDITKARVILSDRDALKIKTCELNAKKLQISDENKIYF